jgi:Flp pilus assembly protein TadG
MNARRPAQAKRIKALPDRLSQFFRGPRARGGMAATEFALVLPVMLILFSGMVTYGTVTEISRKVTLTARNITDLVSQYETLTTSDMNILLNSTSQVMAPFSLATATLVVVQISVDASNKATISWSEQLANGQITSPASGYTPGAAVTLPTNVVQTVAQGRCPTTPATVPNPTGACVILGHVTYVYTPMIGYAVTGSITLSDDIYMNPRLSTGVTINAAQTTP